jgi:hypothetical protein
MKKVLLATLLLLFSMILMGQELPESNRIVLEQASKFLGKKVERGLCRDFVYAVLLIKDHGKGKYLHQKIKNYNYKEIGRRVKVKNALPGDVVVYFGVVTDYMEAISHISIVKECKDGRFVVYEQNAAETLKESVVIESTFNVKDFKRGKIKVYRPF